MSYTLSLFQGKNAPERNNCSGHATLFRQMVSPRKTIYLLANPKEGSSVII